MNRFQKAAEEDDASVEYSLWESIGQKSVEVQRLPDTDR